MKLYYSSGACSLAVRIILNELSSDFTSVKVDLKTKKTEHGDDYLAINSKGAVPALELEAGEIITENAVIQQYLADTFHSEVLLPPLGSMARYRVLEWMNYVSTELHKGCGPLFNPAVPEELKADIFRPLLKKKLSFVNQHLKQNNYLYNDHFTLPDSYLFTILRWMPALKIDYAELDALVNYFNELKKRPSIERSLKEEGIS